MVLMVAIYSDCGLLNRMPDNSNTGHVAGRPRAATAALALRCWAMTDTVSELGLCGRQGQLAARVLGRLAASESRATRAPVHPARGP